MDQSKLKRLWSLLNRVSDEADAHDADIVAAGLAFYGVLGLFPALLAVVSLYGLVSDPIAIQHTIYGLARSLPVAARDLVLGELSKFVAQSSGKLSVGAFLGFLAVLWSSSSAMGALVRAINVAYDLPEKRNFFQRRRAAVLFTLAAMLGMFLVIPLIAILPAVLSFLQIGAAIAALRWLGMTVGAWLSFALLYRYAAERMPALTLRQVLPGASVAAALWVLLCAGYSAYVQHFTSFNATYGALTGVIVLEFWLYISALIVVYGAELNAELERGQHASRELGSEESPPARSA
jgi:membrane protein